MIRLHLIEKLLFQEQLYLYASPASWDGLRPHPLKSFGKTCLSCGQVTKLKPECQNDKYIGHKERINGKKNRGLT
jgi:hypothetical protein